MPNISGGALIIDREIVAENDWVHVAAEDAVPVSGNISVDFARWQADKVALLTRESQVAVRLSATDEPADLQDDLGKLPMIVLQLTNYVDGRCYTQAFWLRKRYGYTGDIRVIGEVYRDQLNFLERVGVTQFELTKDQDPQDALNGFGEFSVLYQPSADEGQNIFSRRRVEH